MEKFFDVTLDISKMTLEELCNAENEVRSLLDLIRSEMTYRILKKL